MQFNDPETQGALRSLEDKVACVREMLTRMRAEMEAGGSGEGEGTEGLDAVDDLPIDCLYARLREWYNNDDGKAATDFVTLSTIHKAGSGLGPRGGEREPCFRLESTRNPNRMLIRVGTPLALFRRRGWSGIASSSWSRRCSTT